jgi:DNA-binding response OmpR family regulator
MENHHILLVEDDDKWRQTLARALQKARYAVTEACDGRTAIELLQQPHEHSYQVVITDIVMGDIDGIEVANVARSLSHTPEVILLTGHGSLETAMAAVRAGAFDYLLKPCRITHLLERVAAAVEHHQEQQRQVRDAHMLHTIAGFVRQAEAPPASTTRRASPLVPAGESHQAQYLRVGTICVDTYRHEVWFNEQRVHVTRTEYMVLSCLASSSGRVVSYGDIVHHIRGYKIDEAEAHSLLRTHVRNLRRKIDRHYLVSVHGIGYMLTEPDQMRNESTTGH